MESFLLMESKSHILMYVLNLLLFQTILKPVFSPSDLVILMMDPRIFLSNNYYWMCHNIFLMEACQHLNLF